MKQTLKDKLLNNFVNAFVKNKIISAIPSKLSVNKNLFVVLKKNFYIKPQ